MMWKPLAYFFYEASWPVVFGGLVVYFLWLYFGLGSGFNKICQMLTRRGMLEQIITEKPSSKQIQFEIRHSLLSILNFSFSGLLVVYLVRAGFLTLRPESGFALAWGLALLTLWNEVHFFMVHRLMHFPFFMRRVHWVHHRSRVPNVYSVYSFHFVESLLLSTVQISLLCFIRLSPLTIVFFPVVSLLLNLAGHCNYRFKARWLPAWLHFGTRHNLHHQKNSPAYGFATPLLDQLFPQKPKRK